MQVSTLATFEGFLASEDVPIAEAALKAISYLDEPHTVL